MERKNLWAPWRLKYIRSLSKTNECFFCHNLANPQDDAENFVLWRTPCTIVIFNRYPYNNGHLLVAPIRHIADLEKASDEEMNELLRVVRDVQKILTLAVNPKGFNIGINIGRCAGAGIPEHLHIHVVPRWEGDTNFMSVCTDTKIISQSLTELYKELKEVSTKHNLPQLI